MKNNNIFVIVSSSYFFLSSTETRGSPEISSSIVKVIEPAYIILRFTLISKDRQVQVGI